MNPTAGLPGETIEDSWMIFSAKIRAAKTDLEEEIFDLIRLAFYTGEMDMHTRITLIGLTGDQERLRETMVDSVAEANEFLQRSSEKYGRHDPDL